MVTKETVKRRWYNEKKVVIICDICGREYTSRVDIRRCMVCKKDVCLGCVISVTRDSRLWHGFDNWCCKICWVAGKDRREILEAAEEAFTAIVEEQFSIWRHDIGGVEDGQ